MSAQCALCEVNAVGGESGAKSRGWVTRIGWSRRDVCVECLKIIDEVRSPRPVPDHLQEQRDHGEHNDDPPDGLR